ncbi:MAG TPA: proline dehydrogenase family protein [Candidatus Eisenbacteria bacterium]|nr:proline dehydrogenase family protein [Candidatus Eisenbacteria bacterium]
MLRTFFIKLSENQSIRHFAENSAVGLRFSSRFVAGMHLPDAVAVTERINKRGASVTIDNLGENVTNIDEAKHSAALYHQMLDEIAVRKLNANISLKLTHMGFDVDEDLAFRQVTDLVSHAVQIDSFVRVDMEGSAYTQRTLDFVRQLHRQPGHAGKVGTVIQSYLYRSENDVKQLLAERIRIRLCKGAYKEPAEVAFPKKADVDANYLKLAQMLLKSGVYHGLATHDEKIIAQMKQFAGAENIPPTAYEFQMLHGVRRDLQQKLVREGYALRVYIPFGTEWYPYFMRRLAERPANVFFIARNMFRQ